MISTRPACFKSVPEISKNLHETYMPCIIPAQVISVMNESVSINTFLFATMIQISEIFHALSKYLSQLNEED